MQQATLCKSSSTQHSMLEGMSVADRLRRLTSTKYQNFLSKFGHVEVFWCYVCLCCWFVNCSRDSLQLQSTTVTYSRPTASQSHSPYRFYFSYCYSYS